MRSDEKAYNKSLNTLENTVLLYPLKTEESPEYYVESDDNDGNEINKSLARMEYRKRKWQELMEEVPDSEDIEMKEELSIDHNNLDKHQINRKQIIELPDNQEIKHKTININNRVKCGSQEIRNINKLINPSLDDELDNVMNRFEIKTATLDIPILPASIKSNETTSELLANTRQSSIQDSIDKVQNIDKTITMLPSRQQDKLVKLSIADITVGIKKRKKEPFGFRVEAKNPIKNIEQKSNNVNSNPNANVIVNIIANTDSITNPPTIVPKPTTISKPVQHMMAPNKFHVKMVQPFTLYDYQEDALQIMIDIEEGKIIHPEWKPNIHGQLLAMKMGLGKTNLAGSLIARTLAQQRGKRSSTLYLCPPNLFGNVRNDLEKLFGDQFRICIYHKDFVGSDYYTFDQTEIRKYDVIIMGYETLVARMIRGKFLAKKKGGKVDEEYDYKNEEKQLIVKIKEYYVRSDSKQIITDEILKQHKENVNILSAIRFCKFQWYRLIFDESADVRARNTQKFKAVMQLESDKRLCMSGTPLHTGISDIINQLVVTGLSLPPRTKINGLQGKELFKRLKLREAIQFIGLDKAKSINLPPKYTDMIYFDLNEKERFLHDFYLNKARDTFQQLEEENPKNEKSQVVMKARSSILRAMQTCTAPYLLTPAAKIMKTKEDNMDDSEDGEPIVFPADLQMNEWIYDKTKDAGISSSKMQTCIKLIQKIRSEEPRAKMIVFANWSSSLVLLTSALNEAKMTDYVFVHGGISSAKQRDVLYTKFRTDESTHMLLMTMKLGASGLNLSEARVILFLEEWWVHSVHAQAEARAHRLSQQFPVHVYYIIPRDSIEERIYRTQQDRGQEEKEVIEERYDKKIGVDSMKLMLGI